MAASRAGNGAPQDRVFRGLAAAAIVIGVAVRLVLPFALPFGVTPHRVLEGLNDEPAHVAYIRYLADHHRFPVLTSWNAPDAFARADFEYHQAPLYYLVCAPFAVRWGTRGSRLACRLLNATLGLLTLWALAGLVRDIGAPIALRRAAVAFLALWMPHVYFTSVISNDAVCALLAVLLARATLRYGAADPGTRAARRSAWGMLAFATLGLYAKSSMLLWEPVLVVAFAHRFAATRDTRALRHGALVVGGSLLLASPWYLRNLMLYHSLLGMPLGGAVPSAGLWLQGLVRGTARSFGYPLQNLPEGSLARRLFVLGFAGLLLAHAALAAARVWRRRQEFTTAVLATLLLVNAAGFAWYARETANNEARFLFPALAAMVWLLFAPLTEWLARRGRAGAIVPYAVALAAAPYGLLLAAR